MITDSARESKVPGPNAESERVCECARLLLYITISFLHRKI